MYKKLKEFFLGASLNPANPKVRSRIAIIALLAWVGLGADALSSSCYGPEQTFLALGNETHLALYIAIGIVLTIFIISLGYSQIIDLFPSGGGGYKVTTHLLHPYVGVIAGSALIVDYTLTIAVSIASGADAFFSLLPKELLTYKLFFEFFLLFFILAINLKGIKDAIIIVMPIFIGFVLIHFVLIIYGIVFHYQNMENVIPATLHETYSLSQSIGVIAVIGLILHAYSLGAGTYTGLEAISNNVQRLAKPKVLTGKRAMLYMSISLSFTAGGILLLYLLWNVNAVNGETLNASLFHKMLGDSHTGQILLTITLLSEAFLLLIAANTGFIDGPNVLGLMAMDEWVPSQFKYLSSRLAMQNGLLIVGLTAAIILFFTKGNISLLVILYSINVFITFTLALFSVSLYWLKHKNSPHRMWHLSCSLLGFITTLTILCITLYYKFLEGGWFTILVTAIFITICFLIKLHYINVRKKLAELDKKFDERPKTSKNIPRIHHNEPTAVILVKNNKTFVMNTLLNINQLFPNQYKNYIFIAAAQVDIKSFRGKENLEKMKNKCQELCDFFVDYCHSEGFPAESYTAITTDKVESLTMLANKVSKKYPQCVFFSSKLIFKYDNWLTHLLHDKTVILLQNYMHHKGKELIILPLKLY